MHPELITIGDFTIHTYGFLIMCGALAGYFYFATTVKKELGIPPEKVQSLAIVIILAAFIGGKIFFYLEDPGYYFHPASNMFRNFRTGFVFYGSLLFAIPVVIWFFRTNKWPLWPMLDRIAITACIIHAFGRMGCFFAGCCHGTPTESFLGVTFTDPNTQADPMNVPLHPTQLYSVFLIVSILVILLMFKRHKRFEGQLFFIYVMLYAAGRSVIEIFRGDGRRGFVIEDVLSHSQFISIFVIIAAAAGYYYFSKKNRIRKKQ